jgi:hypothetical protein
MYFIYNPDSVYFESAATVNQFAVDFDICEPWKDADTIMIP